MCFMLGINLVLITGDIGRAYAMFKDRKAILL